MPTLPSKEPAETPRQPHQARDMAESFGTDPQRYDRTRPSYPPGLIKRIVAERPGIDVLDVGCGTGIASRQLQRAGCAVLGVDVDERMAAYARERGLDAEVAAFEQWDPAGRTFDAVVSGQTWHWIDPVAGAAKAAEVLRPHGRLAIFWNSFEPPTDLAEEFAAVYRRFVPEMPMLHRANAAGSAYTAMVDKAVEGVRRTGDFAEPETWNYVREQETTRDEYLDFLPTSGAAATFSPETLSAVLDGVGAAIDAAGGRFTMRHPAVAFTARRTAR
ncbi:class I SAM-dependent methyltransferase [Solicola gregarius]|uniref:Methyltransferase domain-containing protein n=1 Tax=Solicola gregarius TaxID=2908642 RepID=A0AA46TFK4_9ACTN|nr:class I SAM-dependent methyltransferase [Solicola gregarius]UYM03902.1 methyltransferase domain-containing protein [Solicola gregarius]